MGENDRGTLWRPWASSQGSEGKSVPGESVACEWSKVGTVGGSQGTVCAQGPGAVSGDGEVVVGVGVGTDDRGLRLWAFVGECGTAVEDVEVKKLSSSSKRALYLKVDETTVLAVVDTGADVTILQDTIFLGMEKPPPVVRRVRMRGAGRQMVMAGLLVGPVTLTLGDKEYEDYIYVAPIEFEMLLGGDILADRGETDTVVYVKSRRLFFDAQMLDLMSFREEQGRHAAVTLDETAWVPAGSILRTTARAFVEGLGDYVIEPAVGLKLGMPRVVRGEGAPPVVCLVNPSDHGRYVRKGVIIGYAMEITVVRKEERELTDCQVAACGEESGEKGSGEVPEHLVEPLERASQELTAVQRSGLAVVLSEYSDVFAADEFDLGNFTAIQHEIETGDSRPVKQRMRRTPMGFAEEEEAHLKKMLKAGVIQESVSEWSSAPVLVRKRDGKVRWCIDYRGLNDCTRKDVFPLPLVEDCLDTLAGSKWFSKLDANSAYWQVQIRPEDRSKTAFITKYGLYEHVRMGFGLCNAPATYARVMNLVLRGLNWQTTLAFLDDILVLGGSYGEHLDNLGNVLRRFRQYGLKLKPKKCELFQRKVEFLGRVVTNNSIAMSDVDIEAVRRFPEPQCAKDVERFLGFANYHRNFIKDFSKMAVPLHEVSKSYEWSGRQQQSFRELCDALSSPPVLALPNRRDPFILDTDASDFAVGAELIQVQGDMEKVIAYGSSALSKDQRKYCATRKELLAVVKFTRRYRHYLLGKPFVVRTDHSSLTWLMRFKEPQGQIARWLEELSQYDMTLQHRAGKKHINADTLSRITYGSPCGNYTAGVELGDLPCGGCAYCQRAHQNWGQFFEEVDDVIPLAQVHFPRKPPRAGGDLSVGCVGLGDLRRLWEPEEEVTAPGNLVEKGERGGSDEATDVASAEELPSGVEETKEPSVQEEGTGKNLKEKDSMVGGYGVTDEDVGYESQSQRDSEDEEPSAEACGTQDRKSCHSEGEDWCAEEVDTLDSVLASLGIGSRALDVHTLKTEIERWSKCLGLEYVPQPQTPHEGRGSIWDPGGPGSNSPEDAPLVAPVGVTDKSALDDSSPGIGQPDEQPDDSRAETSWGVTTSEIAEVQREDLDLVPIFSWLDGEEEIVFEKLFRESPSAKHYWLNKERFVLIGDVLYIRGLRPNQQLMVLPERFRSEAIRLNHDIPSAGHQGRDRTMTKVKEQFFWYGLGLDVRIHIAGCATCNQNKKSLRGRAPLTEFQAGGPMERVHLDFLGPLPKTTRGNNCVLMMVDQFTKWVECIPLPDQTAEVTARAVVDQIFMRLGIPFEIFTDQGRNFESRLFSQMCKALYIHKARTTPYRPSSNGQVERYNRTLMDAVRCFVGKSQTNWDVHLQQIASALRSCVNRQTGQTPNFMMLGRQVITPSYLMFPHARDAYDDPDGYVGELVKAMRLAHTVARDNLRVATKRAKGGHDLRVLKWPYKEGQAVYILDTATVKGKCRKLSPPWKGPAVIVKRISAYLFRVLLRKAFLVVHHDRIKPCTDTTLPAWIRQWQLNPTYGAGEEDDDTLYCVGCQPWQNHFMIA